MAPSELVRYLKEPSKIVTILTFRSRPLTRVGVGSAVAGAAGWAAPAEAFLAAARMGGARTSSGDGTGCCDASTDFRPAEAAAATDDC